MAIETVSPPAATLTDVVNSQNNALYDVIALLSAVEGRLDEAATARADDATHHTLRLVQMARLKVNAAIDAFDVFI